MCVNKREGERECVCERERGSPLQKALTSEDPNMFHLSLILEAEAANKEKHPPTTRSSTFKAGDTGKLFCSLMESGLDEIDGMDWLFLL